MNGQSIGSSPGGSMSGLYKLGPIKDATGAVNDQQDSRQGQRLAAAAVVDQQHSQQGRSSVDDQHDSQQGRHLATAAVDDQQDSRQGGRHHATSTVNDQQDSRQGRHRQCHSGSLAEVRSDLYYDDEGLDEQIDVNEQQGSQQRGCK